MGEERSVHRDRRSVAQDRDGGANAGIRADARIDARYALMTHAQVFITIKTGRNAGCVALVGTSPPTLPEMD
jgi:hypothetical protein